MANSSEPQELQLVIKNPNCKEVSLTVPVNATLKDVQQVLGKQYPGNPEPEQQTLIYAGKVLKDPSVLIKSLLGKMDHEAGPYSFHLVIKQKQQASDGASSSTPDASIHTAPAPPSATPASAATPAAASSDSNAQQAASQAPPIEADQAFPYMHTDAAVPAPAYGYFNPIVASAYQAAYAAALAAGACVQQQQQQAASGSQGTTADGSTSSITAQPSITLPDPAISPATAGAAATVAALSSVSPLSMQSLAMTQAYLSALQAATNATSASSSAELQQQHHHQRIVQLLMGSGMLFPVPPLVNNLGSILQQQQLVSLLLQQQGIPVTTTTTISLANASEGVTAVNIQGARNRRPAAGAAAAVPGAAGQRPHQAQRPRARQRVFTLRISMRALLQTLVFMVVLYQHFTWQRFAALALIALALWVTSLAPLRRFIASLQAPVPVRPAPAPPAPVAAAAAAPPAAGAPAAAAEQPVAQAAAGGAAAAPAAGTLSQPAQQPAQRMRRGVFGEIAVVVVGFITSLLPAWNYDPADAAAFAAAQEFDARDREQQQQAAGAAGARAGAVAANENVPPPQQAGPAAADEAPPQAAAQDHQHQD